jgi:predicted RNase H-like HicB family nuclease
LTGDFFYLILEVVIWILKTKNIKLARKTMLGNFTAKYKKISSGYMGQIVEWPEVVTEGKTLEECREMLEDALKEMMLAYIELKKEIPYN